MSRESTESRWMPRLIWVFPGCTLIFVGFVRSWLTSKGLDMLLKPWYSYLSLNRTKEKINWITICIIYWLYMYFECKATIFNFCYLTFLQGLSRNLITTTYNLSWRSCMKGRFNSVPHMSHCIIKPQNDLNMHPAKTQFSLCCLHEEALGP